jgi:4,5-DOPA dioxygenase extradiol
MEAAEMVKSVKVHPNHEQGLDHGAWSILRHIYPKADVPCFQLSMDYAASAEQHFKLASELKKLREKGVLIIGSGNVVHNLREVNFGDINPKPYDYALEFDDFVRKNLETGNYAELINFQQNPNLARKAHPSFDHYLPLLYTIGLADKSDKLSTLFQGIQMSSISMRSFMLS